MARRRYGRRMSRRRKTFKRGGFKRSRFRRFRKGGFKGGAHRVQPDKSYKGLFPLSKVVTLRWCEAYGVAASAIEPGKVLRVFNAASPFDPDVTGLGTKAKGFAFYAKYYQKYVVIASKCCLRYAQQNVSTSASPLVLCGNLDENGSFFQSGAAPDYRTWTTCPMTKTKFINSTCAGVTPRMATMVLSYNAKRFHHVTNIKDCTQLMSACTGDPQDGAYYSFAHCNVSLGGTTPAVHIFVTIDYKILFTERKPELDWLYEPITMPEQEVDPAIHPYAGPSTDAGPAGGMTCEPPLTPP